LMVTKAVSLGASKSPITPTSTEISLIAAGNIVKVWVVSCPLLVKLMVEFSTYAWAVLGAK